MIDDLLSWVQHRMLSMWGQIPAWGNALWQVVFGDMSGIAALSATLACWLTWLSIKEKRSKRSDLDTLKALYSQAEQAGDNALREIAAEQLRKLDTKPGLFR
jgi:hypothetical protein